MSTDELNDRIRAYKTEGGPTDLLSDGYHTFGELYEHRIQLFVTLCRTLALCDELNIPIWKAKHHADGSSYPGWFIMGIHTLPGRQISYHLPEYWWDRTFFAKVRDRAPDWDGHTSTDVLERLRRLT